jgi:hypothetical protein
MVNTGSTAIQAAKWLKTAKKGLYRGLHMFCNTQGILIPFYFLSLSLSSGIEQASRIIQYRKKEKQ